MLDTGFAAAARRDGAALVYNLAGIATLVLLAAVGFGYAIDQLSRNEQRPLPQLDAANPIAQTIGGHELSIPASWFRYGEQVRAGFTDQIDLMVMLDLAGEPAPVNVTLLPRSRVRTSASLVDAVYLHQFDAETLEGVPGLIGKPMLDSNGYGGESVWYDALSPNPFVAKCQAEIGGEGGEQCVRTVYLPSGIAAVYTFKADLLPAWKEFDAAMQLWLGRIGAW